MATATPHGQINTLRSFFHLAWNAWIYFDNIYRNYSISERKVTNDCKKIFEFTTMLWQLANSQNIYDNPKNSFDL